MTNLEAANCRAWKRKFLTLCFLQEVVRCRSPTALFRYFESSGRMFQQIGGGFHKWRYLRYPQNGWFIIEHPITMEESLISTRCHPWFSAEDHGFLLWGFASWGEDQRHPGAPKKKTKKHPFGLRYIQIIPDPSRLQNWFKGKSAGTPPIFFRSNSRLPVHISHKPSQGLKDEQVPTGIFGMRE